MKSHDNDKIFFAKISDLFRFCDKYAAARFSDFLDGAEQAAIEDRHLIMSGYNVMFFGGYIGSERNIMGVFPEWCETDENEFPIMVLTIENGIGGKLSHRDYLGSVLSLGIERSKIGDICVDSDNNRAFVFVHKDIAEYIKNNITKIGKQGVKISLSNVSSIVVPKPKFQNINTVCASMRADAVVGAACGKSRSKAAELIRGEKIKINHRVCNDTSKQLNEGDLLSIGGTGRFIVSEASGKTRSGRIHIVLLKYI